MDLEQIQELIKIVAESGVAEVEVEEDDLKIVVRRSGPTVMMQQPSAPAYGYGPPQGYGAPPAQQPSYAPQPGQGAPQQPPAQQSPGSSSNPAAASNVSPNNGASPAPDTSSAPSPEGDTGDEVATAENETVVKAPIVGTFYRAPSPDSDPYVEEGDTVQEDDILCIIEAMKLMNEIECETPGTIKEILVEDAEPVEFDQPLFVIERA